MTYFYQFLILSPRSVSQIVQNFYYIRSTFSSWSDKLVDAISDAVNVSAF